MNLGQEQRQNSPQFTTVRYAESRMRNPLTRSLRIVGYLSPRRVPLTSLSVLASAGVLRLSSGGIPDSTQKK